MQYCWKMTQKHIFLKNGLIIGEMEIGNDKSMDILWKNLPHNFNIQVDLWDLSFAPTSVKTRQCALSSHKKKPRKKSLEDKP